MEKKLLFEDSIKENKDAFILGVRRIAKDLEINPDWLMAVMYAETIGTFSPSIENKKFPLAGGYATGLIQFTPLTAVNLGTSVMHLKTLSNVQQLNYVLKYLLPYKGEMKSYKDVYTAVFFPRAIGKPDNYVLRTDKVSPATIALNNPVFDLNKDLQITVAELRKAFLSVLPEKVRGVLDDSIKKK